MLTKIVAWFSRAHPGLRALFFQRLYQYLAWFFPRKDWKFMNYGFAPLDGKQPGVCLEEADEPNRLYIQLYHHLASQVALEGLSVLEVGSGRGGGAEYLKRYFKPARMVGLDLSTRVVEFCSRVYDLEGLDFQAGSAEDLPFPEADFDVVINVESSHCYASMAEFLAQTRRVLRQGGILLLADFRRTVAMANLRELLFSSGLSLLNELDITPQILKALELDHEPRSRFIEEMVPRGLAGFAGQFAGTGGSKISERLKSGETTYFSFVLQKQPV